MRKFVTQAYHSIAHLTLDKLDPLIRTQFDWPNMTTFISKLVIMCKVCQQCKADHVTPKAPLILLSIPERPMQFIAVDIATLPQNKDGIKAHIISR